MKLINKHEAFCLELVIDWNETQAYSRAYNNKNLASCAANASKLLRNPNINKRIAELKAERNAESFVDRKYVIDKAKFIIESDFTALMELGYKGCDREEFDKIPKELRCLINDFKVQVNIDRRDGRETEKITFKFMSKDKAHDILAKHTGTYSDINLNVNNNLGDSITDLLKAAKKEVKK